MTINRIRQIKRRIARAEQIRRCKQWGISAQNRNDLNKDGGIKDE